MIYWACIGYWIGGALVGYGFRGLVFNRQKQRIINGAVDEALRTISGVVESPSDIAYMKEKGFIK